jgi:phospholipase/lecithinase/hemolysin
MAGPTFDAVYVFGDSYCDVGNIYTATKGTTPPPPYYSCRFSNGPIWIEHLASAWGLPMQPSLKGGTDYAFGGAMVTQSVSTPLGTIFSVPAQAELYLSEHGGHADPTCSVRARRRGERYSECDCGLA